MLFSFSTLSLAFVATMASASSIDNTQMQAVVLATQAKVSGSYTFRNVQTGNCNVTSTTVSSSFTGADGKRLFAFVYTYNSLGKLPSLHHSFLIIIINTSTSTALMQTTHFCARAGSPPPVPGQQTDPAGLWPLDQLLRPVPSSNSGKANVYTQSSKKSVSLKWTRVSGTSGNSKGSWQGVSIADGSSVSLTQLGNPAGPASAGAEIGPRVISAACTSTSNGKCLAAQYGKQNGQGKDIAAVAYACRTSGESVAKQVWALVPCGTSSSAITFSKNVSRRRRSLDLEDRAENAAITEPVVVDEDEDEDENENENDVEESPLFTDEDVTEYTETDDKADFDLGKRDFSATYCILTHDHLFDQRARAVGSTAVKSAGGFTSQGMVDFNAKDKSQWWAVVSS
ncbi:BQ5605_C023g09619 [Microbotryum silenes-dioicae]|uniref:BQ5605_C023g09619 protein n=1 Tax=Microbotryum silenes-dioicae TaxID=796604 RepID=A0A2X0PKP4_9BASI|nr:BQ5605_C023g09619 [Microbotryum silenes-dioicae]